MTIPASGAITGAMLNTECDKPAGSAWSMDAPYSRLLGNRPSGAISFADYRSRTWPGGRPVVGVSNSMENSGGANVWQATGPNLDDFDFVSSAGWPKVRPNIGTFENVTLSNGVTVYGFAVGWQDGLLDPYCEIAVSASMTATTVKLYLNGTQISVFSSNMASFSRAGTTNQIISVDIAAVHTFPVTPLDMMVIITV